MSGEIARENARTVWANEFVVVHDDDVRFADGRTGRYLRIDHAGFGAGAVVVATHRERVALVRVYRYPISRWQWGFPRGYAVSSDPTVTARQELREELGIHLTEQLEVLGRVTPDSGLLSSAVDVVHVAVATTDAAPEDVDEVDAVRWVTIPELEALVRDGSLDDGITLAAVAIARAHGVLATS